MYVEDEQNTSLNQKNRWHQMQSRTVMFFSNIKPYRRDMALTSLLLAKQKLGRHDRITVVASCRSASNSCSLCLFVYHRIEELICARFIQNEGGTRVWPIPLRQAPSSFYNRDLLRIVDVDYATPVISATHFDRSGMHGPKFSKSTIMDAVDCRS